MKGASSKQPNQSQQKVTQQQIQIPHSTRIMTRWRASNHRHLIDSDSEDQPLQSESSMVFAIKERENMPSQLSSRTTNQTPKEGPNNRKNCTNTVSSSYQDKRKMMANHQRSSITHKSEINASEIQEIQQNIEENTQETQINQKVEGEESSPLKKSILQQIPTANQQKPPVQKFQNNAQSSVNSSILEKYSTPSTQQPSARSVAQKSIIKYNQSPKASIQVYKPKEPNLSLQQKTFNKTIEAMMSPERKKATENEKDNNFFKSSNQASISSINSVNFTERNFTGVNDQNSQKNKEEENSSKMNDESINQDSSYYKLGGNIKQEVRKPQKLPYCIPKMKTSGKSNTLMSPQKSKQAIENASPSKLEQIDEKANIQDQEAYVNLKKEVNEFLRQNNLRQVTDKFDHANYIQYDEFKRLLIHLKLVDQNRINPVQDYLIGQMWVKELQGLNDCCIKNVVTLLVAVLGIKNQTIFVAKGQDKKFKVNDGLMAFNDQGESKFLNQDDADKCLNRYLTLSKQREKETSKSPPKVQNSPTKLTDSFVSQNKTQPTSLLNDMQQQNFGRNQPLNCKPQVQSLKDQPRKSILKKPAPTTEGFLYQSLDGKQKLFTKENQEANPENKANKDLQLLNIQNSGQKKQNNLKLADKEPQIFNPYEETKGDTKTIQITLKAKPVILLNKDAPSNEQKSQSVPDTPLNFLQVKTQANKTKDIKQPMKRISNNVLSLPLASNEALNDSGNSTNNQKVEIIKPFNIVPRSRQSGETPRINVGQFDNQNQSSKQLDQLSATMRSEGDTPGMSTLNLPGTLGKITGGMRKSMGRSSNASKNRRLALELLSPDDFLSEISEIPINTKFDIKQKMPVDEDSDKVSFFGKHSHGSNKVSDVVSGNKDTDESGRKARPLLFMDVNLGAQKGVQKLIVYEKDSPRYIASKFGEMHQLREKAVTQLERLLNKKIEEALHTRKKVIKEEDSPEMKSRSPSPTLVDMKVVSNSRAIKVKSNTTGPIQIKRKEELDDDW
ncbi:UNKNOWN [Stylonychia lemnae]|uniref:Uncharacterized protein n=1 Tax=Stylonychia lemnae TaxID=5949 RepID=A0A078B9B7_STYLE|nr:UNKNOWN [Stylonychia lemnae]|eukprot:CDW90163.1 UNKNOWN [Stylonychia lemnae]